MFLLKIQEFEPEDIKAKKLTIVKNRSLQPNLQKKIWRNTIRNCCLWD